MGTCCGEVARINGVCHREGAGIKDPHGGGWRQVRAIPNWLTTRARLSIEEECGDLLLKAHRVCQGYSPNAAATEHVLDKNPATDASGFTVGQEAPCRSADCWQGQL